MVEPENVVKDFKGMEKVHVSLMKLWKSNSSDSDGVGFESLEAPPRIRSGF